MMIADNLGRSSAGSDTSRDSVLLFIEGVIGTPTVYPAAGEGNTLLLVIHSGQGTLLSESAEYRLGKESLYWGTFPFDLRLIPTEGYLSFSACTVKMPRQDSDTAGVLRSSPGKYKSAAALLRQIRFLLAGDASSFAPTELSSEIREALLRLLESDSSIRPAPPYYMAAMKNILDTRFAENLSLDTLSRELHINKFKLAKEFRLLFGASPIEYLIARRLESAEELLCHSQKSITQIANDVGMENVSYFVRRFKKTHGVPPLKFRNLVLAGEEAGIEFSQKDRLSCDEVVG